MDSQPEEMTAETDDVKANINDPLSQISTSTSNRKSNSRSANNLVIIDDTMALDIHTFRNLLIRILPCGALWKQVHGLLGLTLI